MYTYNRLDHHNDLKLYFVIGQYQPNSGSAACVSTPVGYIAASGASAATPCPSGKLLLVVVHVQHAYS